MRGWNGARPNSKRHGFWRWQVKVWVNGVLYDPEQARVSVFDHGMLVGDGIFETIKAVRGEPFALTRHLDRLGGPAKGLGLVAPDLDAIRQGTLDVLASA